MLAPSLLSEWGWSSPPNKPSLAGDEVHVWRVSLPQPAPQIRDFRQTLAPDELARAARFHFQKDRDHFISARGMLRNILGQYLSERPDRLRFQYSRYGKPSLAGEPAAAALRFNLAHSHQTALIAVTLGREVGVDVEHVRADVSHRQIAERFFSPPEFCMLEALSPDAQVEAFFNCWARKEAYIKAKGEGLSHPLDEFDVTLRPGEKAALIATRRDPQEASRWSMFEPPLGPDYKAALVVEGEGLKLRLWH